MTKSKLATVFIPSPNGYFPRSNSINKVTIHHMAGNLSVESCGSIFASPSRQASSNYGVGSDGRIACYLEEENAPWTSSSYWNDNQAITLEVADEDTENWIPSKKAYEATIALCADICLRYDIEPSYTGDSSGTFTEHLMFGATGCPGPWWHSHMPQVVEDVKKKMKGEEDDPVTYEEMEQIAEMCAAKVAESAYWPEDKKEQWGPAGKGSGKYIRNNYNILRFIHDELLAIAAKIDKIQVGGVDYQKIAKAVNDDSAKRMQS